MRTDSMEIKFLSVVVLVGLFVSGCTKNDSNSSAPAAVAVTPAPVATEPETDSGNLSKDRATLSRLGCPATGDLDTNCIQKLVDRKYPKMPMFVKNGGFNKNTKGPWILRQMYRVREDKTFRKMRGINHDYSKAGPMLVWNDGAEFRGWAYEDYNYISHEIKKTRDGAVRFEFERDSLFVIDTFVLECFVPAMMEGKKLLCVWYHQNPRSGRDDFRGYIEFDRAKRYK